MKDDLVAFLVGSSSLATVVTHAYVGAAHARSGRPRSVPMEWSALFVGGVYGVSAVVLKRAVLDRDADPNWSLLVGAVTGVVLSIVGRFGLDLPRLSFDFRTPSGAESGAAWTVHLVAAVLYALIFRLLVLPLVVLALAERKG